MVQKTEEALRYFGVSEGVDMRALPNVLYNPLFAAVRMALMWEIVKEDGDHGLPYTCDELGHTETQCVPELHGK